VFFVIAEQKKPQEARGRAAEGAARRFDWRRYEGFLFIAPWLLGFLFFTLGPMLGSLALSFTKWDMLMPAPKFVGLKNYQTMFADPDWWQSCSVTIRYAIISVPTGMLGSLVVALLLNQKVRGITVFRTIYYLPAVTSSVAMYLLWMWVFNANFGLLNYILGFLVQRPLAWFGIHITLPGWLADPNWALPALIIMNLWYLGGGMIIYLAGLQGIPDHYYEAAELDGAGWWAKFRHVTIPMLSPTIFFNLTMSIIGSFQVFTNVFMMTSGGPGNASLMLVLYIYRNAFVFFRMGYASLLAWIDRKSAV